MAKPPVTRAEEELRHLKPKHTANEYGLVCGACAGLVLGIFATIAGLDMSKFGLPGAAVIGIAFAGPWLYYRSQWGAYYEALTQRIAELERGR